MPEWYSYDKGKPFLCHQCGKEVPADGKRWWNKNDKQSVCDACHGKTAETPQASSKPIPTNTVNPFRTPELPQATCDACGDVIAAGKERHHILKGGRWLTVCFYCYHTVRRARALKVAGLWPFEKRKDIGEQYDLTPDEKDKVEGGKQ